MWPFSALIFFLQDGISMNFHHFDIQPKQSSNLLTVGWAGSWMSWRVSHGESLQLRKGTSACVPFPNVCREGAFVRSGFFWIGRVGPGDGWLAGSGWCNLVFFWKFCGFTGWFMNVWMVGWRFNVIPPDLWSVPKCQSDMPWYAMGGYGRILGAIAWITFAGWLFLTRNIFWLQTGGPRTGR